MNAPAYSAYIPAYNAASTLGAVISSLRAQTIPPREILVVDDGSTDASSASAESLGAAVLRHPANLGRGAARRHAVETLQDDFILCCDAGNRLAPDFAARALGHFSRNPRLASVMGHISQLPGGDWAHRWRGRHLFLGRPGPLQTTALHITSAAMVRRAAVLEVGNYRSELPAHEDSDLGNRLRDAGWHLWCDPTMLAEAITQNTLAEVFARYARWYEPRERGWSWRDYPRNLRQALRIHLRDDLAACDVPSAFASLLLPHYLFWYGCCRKRCTEAVAPAPSTPVAAGK